MVPPTDPFRFDDRTGHYGSGQADLAPVSPLAAPPRDVDETLRLDPMGAPPSESQTAGEDLAHDLPRDGTAADLEKRADSQTSTTFESGAVSAQTVADITTAATVSADMREAPAREAAVPLQSVLLQTQVDFRAETDIRADAADTPVRSGGTPVDLLPGTAPEAADSAHDFADMAARMDQMMAEIMARMETLSPRPVFEADDDAIDPGPLADAQDRLDDLFGSLGDRFGDGSAVDADDRSDIFEAARDRVDDLAGGFGPPGDDASNAGPDPLADASARLDDLKAGLGRMDQHGPLGSALSPDLGASLLARLFDGDAVPDQGGAADRMADLLGGMDDPFFAPPSAGLDAGRWDDLPDFG